MAALNRLPIRQQPDLAIAARGFRVRADRVRLRNNRFGLLLARRRPDRAAEFQTRTRRDHGESDRSPLCPSVSRW